MLDKFRRKKKDTCKKGNQETKAHENSLKAEKNEHTDQPKYVRKTEEQDRTKLAEMLGGHLQRLRRLERERLEVVEEIYHLGEEAEKEAEKVEKELLVIKKQTAEFEQVLGTIQAHRRATRIRNSK